MAAWSAWSAVDNCNTPVGVGTGGQESSQEAGGGDCGGRCWIGGSMVPDGVG